MDNRSIGQSLANSIRQHDASIHHHPLPKLNSHRFRLLAMNLPMSLDDDAGMASEVSPILYYKFALSQRYSHTAPSLDC